MIPVWLRAFIPAMLIAAIFRVCLIALVQFMEWT